MRFLDDTLEAAQTLYSSEAALLDLLPRTDLLIGAVLVPGAEAPELVTREMLRVMRNGTVVVDIAVDQGGCIETTRPTTHQDPIFTEEGVIHYCVANMPGAYARTSTQALTNVTFRYVQWLSRHGLGATCQLHPELKRGINCQDGELTCEGVAQASRVALAGTALLGSLVSGIGNDDPQGRWEDRYRLGTVSHQVSVDLHVQDGIRFDQDLLGLPTPDKVRSVQSGCLVQSFVDPGHHRDQRSGFPRHLPCAERPHRAGHRKSRSLERASIRRSRPPRHWPPRSQRRFRKSPSRHRS